MYDMDHLVLLMVDTVGVRFLVQATVTLAGSRFVPGLFDRLFKVAKCGKWDPFLKFLPVSMMM